MYLLGDTRSRDEHINAAVVVLDVLNGVLNGTGVTDIDLVEAHINASLLVQNLSRLLSELLLDIHNGNAGDTDLCQSLGHVVSKTTSTAT